jgi:hypothetical protein
MSAFSNACAEPRGPVASIERSEIPGAKHERRGAPAFRAALFSPCLGTVADKFGVGWMIDVAN